MKRVRKHLVKRQFQRAAATYEKEALIQHRVAEHLLDLLECPQKKQIHRVLEIGCCTGLLTRRLVKQCFDISELVLNDLVESFAVQAGNLVGITAISFLPGDIENITLPGPFDLIISSSTFHWVNDLEALLKKLADNLNPGAFLAFSMYGPENLREIRTLTGIGLEYFSMQEIQTMLEKYFSLEHCEQQQETFYFASPMDVLTHLRRSGVNAVSQKPWTKRRLQQFNKEYFRQFSNGQGVRLTYHPLYFVARR